MVSPMLRDMDDALLKDEHMADTVEECGAEAVLFCAGRHDGEEQRKYRKSHGQKRIPVVQ